VRQATRAECWQLRRKTTRFWREGDPARGRVVEQLRREAERRHRSISDARSSGGTGPAPAWGRVAARLRREAERWHRSISDARPSGGTGPAPTRSDDIADDSALGVRLEAAAVRGVPRPRASSMSVGEASGGS
jgi:hypothetical protein